MYIQFCKLSLVTKTLATQTEREIPKRGRIKNQSTSSSIKWTIIYLVSSFGGAASSIVSTVPGGPPMQKWATAAQCEWEWATAEQCQREWATIDGEEALGERIEGLTAEGDNSRIGNGQRLQLKKLDIGYIETEGDGGKWLFAKNRKARWRLNCNFNGFQSIP